MSESSLNSQYSHLVQDIVRFLDEGREQVISSTKIILLQTYRKIGKSIVEFEQGGNAKAAYGKELLINLSKSLRQTGKGFSRSNLQYMRKFYLYFPKMPDMSGKLTWSHYVEILGLEDEFAR